jgi:hypothetical protein
MDRLATLGAITGPFMVIARLFPAVIRQRLIA